MPRRFQQPDPSWRLLARQHWPQYAATVLIFALMELVDSLEPGPRFIYHKSDAEYWRYSRVRRGRAVRSVVPACDTQLNKQHQARHACLGWMLISPAGSMPRGGRRETPPLPHDPAAPPAANNARLHTALAGALPLRAAARRRHPGGSPGGARFPLRGAPRLPHAAVLRVAHRAAVQPAQVAGERCHSSELLHAACVQDGK